MTVESDREGTQRRSRKKLAAAAAAAAVAAASSLLCLSSVAAPPPRRAAPAVPSPPPRHSPSAGAAPRRSLSVALPDGGCRLTHARLSPEPIRPVWQASFPGSGARMTRILIEALTGVSGNDDFDSSGRGYERVAAVKTHYPVKNARRRFATLDVLFDRAIVVLRNPMNAIPSYFNLKYEQLHHLPNHSTRGPNEDWIKFREWPGTHVPYQLKNFERFVDYWMTKYPERRNLLLATYEDLTDAEAGPASAARIADFLGEAEGVDPIDVGSVRCVWESIVERDAGQHSLRKGPDVRPYSGQNLGDMDAALRRLAERYRRDEELAGIVNGYIEAVSRAVPEEEES